MRACAGRYARHTAGGGTARTRWMVVAPTTHVAKANVARMHASRKSGERRIWSGQRGRLRSDGIRRSGRFRLSARAAAAAATPLQVHGQKDRPRHFFFNPGDRVLSVMAAHIARASHAAIARHYLHGRLRREPHAPQCATRIRPAGTHGQKTRKNNKKRLYDARRPTGSSLRISFGALLWRIGCSRSGSSRSGCGGSGCGGSRSGSRGGSVERGCSNACFLVLWPVLGLALCTQTRGARRVELVSECAAQQQRGNVVRVSLHRPLPQ